MNNNILTLEQLDQLESDKIIQISHSGRWEGMSDGNFELKDFMDFINQEVNVESKYTDDLGDVIIPRLKSYYKIIILLSSKLLKYMMDLNINDCTRYLGTNAPYARRSCTHCNLIFVVNEKFDNEFVVYLYKNEDPNFLFHSNKD